MSRSRRSLFPDKPHSTKACRLDAVNLAAPSISSHELGVFQISLANKQRIFYVDHNEDARLMRTTLFTQRGYLGSMVLKRLFLFAAFSSSVSLKL